MADVTLRKEKNKDGEVVSATVTIERDGAFERRRFGSEEEARAFVKRLREEEVK